MNAARKALKSTLDARGLEDHEFMNLQDSYRRIGRELKYIAEVRRRTAPVARRELKKIMERA
jgi:hypothetical protein